jgi:hypothetical protein
MAAVQKNAMTAVLAVLGRAVLAAALLAAGLAACLLTAFGPHGAWTLAWIGVVCVVVSCAVLAWYALPPENERGGRPVNDDSGTGPGLACPGCGSPDVDLRRGLLCGTCAAAAAAEGGGTGG